MYKNAPTTRARSISSTAQCLRHHVRRQTELDPIFMNRSGLLHSAGHTHNHTLLVVCVPTDSDAGPDDSRRVGNVILPHLYHPLRLCYTLCLVAGAISCCFSCLPAAIVGNNEFSRIRPSFGECAFDDYGNTGWSTNTET